MPREAQNNWKIEYNFIRFFERVLSGHPNVMNYDRSRDILFSVVREKGGNVTPVIVNEYVLGMDAYYRIRDEFPEADWIVNLANWNSYTVDAKYLALRDNIALFIPSELTGGIWSSKPASYQRRDKDGNPISYAAGSG